MTSGRTIGILVVAAVVGVVVGVVTVRPDDAPATKAAADASRPSAERSTATATPGQPATVAPTSSPSSGVAQPTTDAVTSVPLTAAPRPTPDAVTSTPVAAPRPTPEPRGRSVVFFAIPGSGPVAVYVAMTYVGPSASDRIFSRLRALPLAAGGPPNAVNVASAMKARLIEVTLETKERVIVDFSVPSDGWGVGADRAKLLAQQLVFTATEEEGVEVVIITQNGGKSPVIAGDAQILNGPRSRADFAR